jgi:hypothetical protein
MTHALTLPRIFQSSKQPIELYGERLEFPDARVHRIRSIYYLEILPYDAAFKRVINLVVTVHLTD